MRTGRFHGLGVLAGLISAGVLGVWWLSRRSALPEAPVDFEALLGEDREGVEVRDLGDGFVELVGEVGSWGEADRIEEEVVALPGIVGVVNRLWIV